MTPNDLATQNDRLLSFERFSSLMFKIPSSFRIFDPKLFYSNTWPSSFSQLVPKDRPVLR